MGGGEVARCIGGYGEDRLRSVVFASAVPPYLAKTDDNPDGPLDQATADGMESGLKGDRDAFFATTDFREDLTKVTVPTLVIHGGSDGVVPFEGSGKRTHEAIAGSELALLQDAPHGCNVTDAEAFNRALLAVVAK